MAGLYQRKTSSLQASPGMSVTPSSGAGAAVPSGSPRPGTRQSFDASALGGLLGLIQRSGGSSAQGADSASSGVFNASLMPGAGQALSLDPPAAGNFGPGVPSAPSDASAAAPASSAAGMAQSGALQTALSPLGAASAQGAASSTPASGGLDLSSLAFLLGALGGRAGG